MLVACALKECESFEFVDAETFENLTKAGGMNLVRGRSTRVPLFTFEHESQLLKEAGTFFSPLQGKDITFPPCSRDSKCVGMTEQLMGAEGKGFVLTRAMTPEEHAHLLNTGSSPVAPGLCVLCARYTVSKALVFLRALNDQADMVASERRLLNGWRVPVGPGGYTRRKCFTPCSFGQVFVSDTFPMYGRGDLVVRREQLSGRRVVDQSALKHRIPPPSAVHVGMSVQNFLTRAAENGSKQRRMH